MKIFLRTSIFPLYRCYKYKIILLFILLHFQIQKSSALYIKNRGPFARNKSIVIEDNREDNMTVENINLLIYGSGKNQIQSIIKLQTNLNPDKMNMKNNSQHRKIKNYNKNSMNEDDFDYEYDEDYNTSTEENWHFQEMGVSSVLFLMELYGTIYGLSYGIFAQINYFFHVNVIKDREPEHLGSYNNNITIANS